MVWICHFWASMFAPHPHPPLDAGMPAEGELARPFAVPPNPMEAMLKGVGGSDEAAVMPADGNEKQTAKETRRKRMKAE